MAAAILCATAGLDPRITEALSGRRRTGGVVILDPDDTPPPSNGRFTAEELAYVRSLPKREKKTAVAALQEKYRKGKLPG